MQPRRTSRPLIAIAYGFFALGVGINVWNAWTSGALTDMALPATLGVLAEGVVFFLPAWALTLPVGRQRGGYHHAKIEDEGSGRSHRPSCQACRQ